MKKLLATLGLSLGIAGLAIGSITAQQQRTNEQSSVKISRVKVAANEGVVKLDQKNGSEKKSNASVQAVSGTPLKLRNGAVPTGLQGFYDYQSNGWSPSYIRHKGNTIHTCYMLASDKGQPVDEDAGDTGAVSRSRRVGYSYSTDGGQTWKANKDIAGYRCGFPYMQITNEGIPVIICHGYPSATSADRIISQVWVGEEVGSTSFINANYLPYENQNGSTGGDNAGVIWPCIVLDKTGTKAIAIASIGPTDVTLRESISFASFELGAAQPIEWKELSAEQTAKSSGGNYVMSVSENGKVGIAYEHLWTEGDRANSPDEVFNEDGIYFIESSDFGKTWTKPVKAIGNQIHNFSNDNDDEDTLNVNGTMDLSYIGETPCITASGGLSNLFVNSSILLWTPTSGVKPIAKTDLAKGLGIRSLARLKTQPNMSPVDYPTISVAPDNKHIVVCFQAWATSDGDTMNVRDENGFLYSRLWYVASKDGGKNWGAPFIVQDFAGTGDSASCEYPSLSPAATSANGTTETYLTFQARRNPGAYAFRVTGVDTDGDGASDSPADKGKFSECFQYVQKISVPDNNAGDVAKEEAASSALSLRAYPNPTNGKTNIQYSLPSSGSVVVKLYNALGEEVYTIKNEKAFSGTYTDELDITNLQSGTYRCVVNQNGVTATRMIHLVK